MKFFERSKPLWPETCHHNFHLSHVFRYIPLNMLSTIYASRKMSLLSTKWVKLTPEISHYFGSWHLGYKIARQEAFGKIVKEVEGFITRERESDKREKNCDLTFIQFFAGLSRAVCKIIQLTQ